MTIDQSLAAVKEVVHSIWAERWDVMVLIITIKYHKELFRAIAGGNGHLQTNEIAKALIMFVFYASFRIESTRTDLTHQVFGDWYWFALLGAVAYLAGIKSLIKGEAPKLSQETTT